jgi:D-psicose/D-tagatose/L-ribulose 3-epimerase
MTARFLFACVLSLIVFPVRADSTNLTIGYCTGNIAAAKAAGFDFAEVPVSEFMKLSDDGFETFAAGCRGNGLPVTAAYMFLPADLKVVGPEVHLEAVTNYFIKALDRCQRLGVKTIAWGSGASRRTPDGFSREEAFAQLVALAKYVAPEARKRGIVIVAEALRRAESNTINTAAEGLKWVEAVNDPNFQLLVDPFHMTQENEDVAIIVKAGKHIAHIHFSNPQGRGFPSSADTFDYTPFFRALHQIGYHGTISIEAKTGDLAKDGPVAIKFIRAAYAAAGEN